MAEIVQLVNSEGHFDEVSTKQFVTVSGLAECKTNYQIVAIMGPQSSGKSTLLNHVVRWPRGIDVCSLLMTQGLPSLNIGLPLCSLEQILL